jgi:hypothetical protein
MYELTDRLAYYLCSRKPDHQIGQHYIVPEMSDSLDQTEFARAAKNKLQLVSIIFAIIPSSCQMIIYFPYLLH